MDSPGPGVLRLRAGGHPALLNTDACYWIELLRQDPWNVGGGLTRLHGGVMRALADRQAGVLLRLASPAGWIAAHIAAEPDVEEAFVVLDLARTGHVLPLLTSAYGLTAAEKAVNRLALHGRSTKGMARHLRISHHTVNDHLKAIYTKTGINGRGQLQHHFALDAVPRTQPDQRRSTCPCPPQGNLVSAYAEMRH